MPRRTARAAVLAAAVAAVAAGASDAAARRTPAAPKVRTGPAGARFYTPPARLLAGPPGTLVWARPATGIPALPAAARTQLVLYRSRSSSGAPVAVSGTVSVPRGPAPVGGWPIVSWAHVTTGSADVCAPSRATADNPEIERMVRGDRIATRLLQAGIAVARSDGEGIGTPGPHPYLMGTALARAQIEIVRAARRADGRIGRRWAAAGHSEGGIATLFSASLARRLAPELDLRAAAAAAPPTHTRDLLDLLRGDPVALPGGDPFSGLAGLIIGGAEAVDPGLGPLLRHGALSPRATALLPQLEQRCLVELTRPDSWGGLAPAQIPGPRFPAIRKRFYDLLDANDPLGIELGPTPIRLDQGLLDAVAPFPFLEDLVRRQRARGADITYARHPTATHVDVTSDAQAAPAIVSWLAARLQRP